MSMPPDQPAMPGQPRRSKAGLIVVVVVLVIAAGVSGAILLTSSRDEDGPEEVVEDFYAAFLDEDCSRIVDFASSNALEVSGGREALVQDCEASVTAASIPDDAQVENIEVAEDEGNRVLLDVTRSGGGQETTDKVVVVREDGQWKVDVAQDPKAESSGPSE